MWRELYLIVAEIVPECYGFQGDERPYFCSFRRWQNNNGGTPFEFFARGELAQEAGQTMFRSRNKIRLLLAEVWATKSARYRWSVHTDRLNGWWRSNCQQKRVMYANTREKAVHAKKPRAAASRGGGEIGGEIALTAIAVVVP